jgi:hypothetical protein
MRLGTWTSRSRSAETTRVRGLAGGRTRQSWGSESEPEEEVEEEEEEEIVERDARRKYELGGAPLYLYRYAREGPKYGR